MNISKPRPIFPRPTRTFLVRALIALFVLGIAAFRSPAPVVEAPEPTAAPSPVEQKTPEEKQPSKTRHKKETTETKTKKQPSTPAKPARSSTAVVPSAGFAGTWKGKMADGADWMIVIDPSETRATAYGPLGSEGGAAHAQGNKITWSYIARHQNNPWSMTLLPGGRRAEVTAFHVSGNISGTLEKTN